MRQHRVDQNAGASDVSWRRMLNFEFGRRLNGFTAQHHAQKFPVIWACLLYLAIFTRSTHAGNERAMMELKPAVVCAGHTARVNGAAFLTDGKRVVSASDDGTAKLWDAETGECLHTFAGTSGAFTRLPSHMMANASPPLRTIAPCAFGMCPRAINFISLKDMPEVFRAWHFFRSANF